MNRCIVLLVLASTSLASPAFAQTTASDGWTWRATIYGWLPRIDASTQFGVRDDSISVDTGPSNYLSQLKFGFLGGLEARKGPWSVFGDAIYIDAGGLNSRVRSIGRPGGIVAVPVQTNVKIDLESFLGSIALGYALVRSPEAPLDVFAGVRYARVAPSVEWEFSTPVAALPRRGSADAATDVTDGIVGVRGRAPIGGNWFLPYYADVGAGSSRLTWQAALGVAYRCSWGDVTLAYRHLAYRFSGDGPVSDITLSGPLVGVSFRF